MTIDFFIQPENLIYTYLIGTFLLVTLLFIIIAMIANRINKKKIWQEIGNYTLLQVTRTKSEKEEGLEASLKSFEELIHSIVPEKKSITFEIAVPNNENHILFLIATPKEYLNNIKTQIRRIFDNSQIQEMEDYSIFDKNNSNLFFNINLKSFFGVPIRTYKQTNTDTFSSILAVFNNVKEKGWGMTMQIVVKKGNKKIQNEMLGVLNALKNGKKLKHIKPNNFFDSVGSFFAKGGGTPEEIATHVEEKTLEQNYQTNIRLAISTPTEKESNLLFENIRDRFAQFESPNFNSFKFIKMPLKKIASDFVFRRFKDDGKAVLKADEITSIFRFLNENINLDSVEYLKTKRVPAPNDAPTEGIVLGDNIFNNEKRTIHMLPKDRVRHTYVIGQTGTGKSAFLKSLAFQDITKGKGVCIIDPHGDLVDDLIGIVPKERIDDVVVFDASNISSPISINMLEYDREKPEQMTFIVNEIMSIFKALFSEESMGPVFEQYMTNSLLLLMEGSVDKPATLVDVPNVLTNETFRNKLLENCKTESVKDFWQKEAGEVEGDLSLSNIAPYITSKFTGFIQNDYIRPIISQPVSSFNFRNLMDKEKILFVKLNQTRIGGKINANLIGMIVVGKITLAAFSRDDISEENRVPFFLYIDEFQNFTTPSISQILSEARKYNLGLIVANQYLSQLKENIKDSVLGNVGNMLTFRVGFEDAEVLSKKYQPDFEARDLAEVENLNCVISMLSNGKLLSPFSLRIKFAPKGNDELKNKLVEYSALKFKN